MISDSEDVVSWEYREGGDRGDNWSRPIFDSRRNTRECVPPTRYGQKRQRTAVDRLTGLIRGGRQGCCRRSNRDNDGDRDGGGEDDGRGVGLSS